MALGSVIVSTARLGRRWAVALAIVALVGTAVPAAAESEWCDEGSPPPNDFRLQETGVQSSTSSTSWLNSTSNPEVALNSSGTINISGVSQLEGGVATGMNTALTTSR